MITLLVTRGVCRLERIHAMTKVQDSCTVINLDNFSNLLFLQPLI